MLWFGASSPITSRNCMATMSGAVPSRKPVTIGVERRSALQPNGGVLAGSMTGHTNGAGDIREGGGPATPEEASNATVAVKIGEMVLSAPAVRMRLAPAANRATTANPSVAPTK